MDKQVIGADVRANLRPVQAAAFVGVSTSWLAKFRIYGGGPRFSKIGRAVVYRAADLQEWVDAHSRTSTSNDASGAAHSPARGRLREREAH